MITDNNALEDILGAIWAAQIDLGADAPEFSPSDQLDDIIERINRKLCRCRNGTRRNWFTTALDYAHKAKECHGHDRSEAVALLRNVEEYLTRGNKAHRRKTHFVVGPQGDVKDTSEPRRQ